MSEVVVDREAVLAGLEGYLPPGPFWDSYRERGAGGSRLVMQPLATSHVRIRQRAADLLVDVVPHQTVEMLSSREEEAGLPDECTGGFETFQQRRDAVVSKWRAEGRLDPAYLVERAAVAGFTISINEPKPMMTGWSGVGCDHVGPYFFQFHVTIHDIEVFRWQVGCSEVGEPMCVLPDLSVLRCLIDREKPAHMTPIYFIEEN
ncbi:putative phage tail protein [Kiloniella laminariae]|uniref:putative phage tail protein n=1 Tax=Kiloniella laminariae TaxID=454162 RepID=UPI000381931B|nr:putative phage tail protein [Kiloniella laminariae]